MGSLPLSPHPNEQSKLSVRKVSTLPARQVQRPPPLFQPMPSRLALKVASIPCSETFSPKNLHISAKRPLKPSMGGRFGVFFGRRPSFESWLLKGTKRKPTILGGRSPQKPHAHMLTNHPGQTWVDRLQVLASSLACT